MGLFSMFTHYFMGKSGIIEEGVEILDGKVITRDTGEKKTSEEIKEIPPMKEEWDIPDDYIEAMIRKGVKERTAKEYAIDVRSFGVDPEFLTVVQIKNRIASLQEASKRRKITALKSYARWLLSVDKTSLWVELSQASTKELIS
jgi:hypothetical protein